MQDPKEIEAHYAATPDPWGFEGHPDDASRKHKIINWLNRFPMFERALDIGAGEAWITKDLPAKLIEGFEISATARSRFPRNVLPITKPTGRYDLVIATGCLYSHYDFELFFRMIREHASKVLLTCNIKDWERPELKTPDEICKMRQIHEEEFPYREYIQKLRIFEVQ